MGFDKFLDDLIRHEEKKTLEELQRRDSREAIIVYSGARLNWLGDFLGTPDLKWEFKELDLADIQFTGADRFLTESCDRSPLTFQKKVLADAALKEKYSKIASFTDEPILVRKGDQEKFKVLDGMHRVIGAALKNKKTIPAYVPQNETDILPNCETHTVYDLIRGFQRHAYDKSGEQELYRGLKLLLRTYGNVEKLLKERFNQYWVNDRKVQKIIQKVLRHK